VGADPLGVGADPLASVLEWAHGVRYEDLPASAVEASKAYLTNTAAAILGGSAAPGAVEAVRQVREWGGAPQSTVAVHGFKTSAPLAAFANGVMAHALDYDDTQVGTGFHPNVSLVPALLAASELAAGASGRDLVRAHVVALEVACRMTLAAKNRAAHPWLTTTLFGVFGAAVGASLMLGNGQAALRQAFGIVYSSAGGNRQGLLDGTLIQRVQPGLCAQAGVQAAQLAAQGVTGAQDVLEGRYGLYPSYYGKDYDLKELTRGLGRDYRMLDLALKPFPCCSYSQEPIEAALGLAAERGFDPESVEEAVVSVASQHAAGLVDHPYAPRSCAQVDALFSMQYVIAAALTRKRLGLADFQEAALRDPGVAGYSRRVRVAVDPERPGNVELRLKGGGRLSKRVALARGFPQRPFSASDLSAKLGECGALAAAPRTREQLAALSETIAALERVAKAGRLAECLA
jgi:2-methylcitrate dehydratase PrpD